LPAANAAARPGRSSTREAITSNATPAAPTRQCGPPASPGTSHGFARARGKSSESARNAAPARCTTATPRPRHDLDDSGPALPTALRADPVHREPVREQGTHRGTGCLPALDGNTHFPAAAHGAAGHDPRGQLFVFQKAA